MKKSDVIQHFGSASALARFLRIKPPSITDWGEIIPEGRAYQLQVMTAGALIVDPNLYEKQTTVEHPLNGR